MHELVNFHAQRVIGSAGFRTRINLLSWGFLAGQAGIPSPLDSSYVPPREIIYLRYVGIESRCTLIRFFQYDWMDLNFQFSLIDIMQGEFYPRFLSPESCSGYRFFDFSRTRAEGEILALEFWIVFEAILRPIYQHYNVNLTFRIIQHSCILRLNVCDSNIRKY